MDEHYSYQTLQEFVAQSSTIQGAVLVSAQGQPLTRAIGLSETTVLILAGGMRHLAEQVQEECRWQNVEKISIRSAEGYVILACCLEDVFLLVKTASMPSGFLEREVDHTVKKLQAQIKETKTDRLATSLSSLSGQESLNNGSVTLDRENLLENLSSELEIEFIRNCQRELAEYIGPIAVIVCQRIVSLHPNFTRVELIDALARQIPNQQQALEFQQRLLSQSIPAPPA
jgi:predicted regulator of Ras-like GTPase activity (Roadblock/LC7/MglB family)